VDRDEVLVALALRGPAGPGVARVVEAALGWHVVAPDDPVLPARCRLVDLAGLRAAGRVPGLVDVLVVDADDPPGEVAAAAREVAGVVGPDPGPDDLRGALDRLAPAAPAVGPWRSVGASAGGVGCTTVAAALAGLRAWRTGPTLLVASGPAHLDAVPTLGPSDLASPSAWAAALPAPGVPDLRIARWRGASEVVPGDVVGPTTVVDLGPVDVAAGPLDVLVVRPDRAGVRTAGGALGRPVVVVVGDGPCGVDAVRRASGGPVVCVAWSVRVAAAAARGRLPAGLPGRWLRPLVPLVLDATVVAA